MIMSCWYSPGEENAQNSRYVEQYFIGTTAGIKTFKDIGQGSSYDTLAAGQLHEFFLVFKYDILYIKLA